MIDVRLEAEDLNPAKGLEPIKDAPVAPAVAIAAIALNMAVKYHDVATIKDGALYQQYKLEGRNFTALHLDHVFETAIQMEKYLMGASDRIAKLVIDAVKDAVIEVVEDDEGESDEAKRTG